MAIARTAHHAILTPRQGLRTAVICCLTCFLLLLGSGCSLFEALWGQPEAISGYVRLVLPHVDCSAAAAQRSTSGGKSRLLASQGLGLLNSPRQAPLQVLPRLSAPSSHPGTQNRSSASENTLIVVDLESPHSLLDVLESLSTLAPPSRDKIKAALVGQGTLDWGWKDRHVRAFLSTPTRLHLRVKGFDQPMVQQMLTALLARNDVTAARLARYAYALGWTCPDDPEFEHQWGVKVIGLPRLWQNGQGRVTDGSVVVAVIDSGVYFDHPDLYEPGRKLSEVEKGYNFVDPNSSPWDIDGHGTHVSGIIAALTNNAEGIAATAPGVTIMPLRVLQQDDKDGLVTYDYTVAEAIRYAADSGADVVNLSLGAQEPCPDSVTQAVDYAWEKGVICVAAAGNTPGDIHWPANADSPGMIAVGALGIEEDYVRRSSYSSRGPELDLLAPGVGILSTYQPLPPNLYSKLSGTSMAAPHVSGVVALMLAKGIPPTQVPRVLQRSCQDMNSPGPDPETGWGALNAYLAVHGKVAQDTIIFLADTSFRPVSEPVAPKWNGSFIIDDGPALRAGRYLVAWLDVDDDRRLSDGDYAGISSVKPQAGTTVEVGWLNLQLYSTLDATAREQIATSIAAFQELP